MDKILMITTKTKGTVAVTNNSNEVKICDDSGYELKRFPKGMVIRWLDQKTYEPLMKFIEGVFKNDFKNDTELADYIDSI